MENILESFDRGRVSNFSKNSYEVVFSVFMVAIAYLYRNSSQIVYPTILYFFLLLMASNFVFNQMLRKRLTVNLWAIDSILLFNLWVITGVLFYSGKGDSYFWVLYLLPIFASALLVSFKDVTGVVFLCALAVCVFSWPLNFSELVDVMSLIVKLSVFIFSAAVVYRTAEAKKRTEQVLVSKRREVEFMARELSEKETEIVRTASAGEIGQVVNGVLHDLGNSVSVILLSAQIVNDDENIDRKDIARIVKAAKLAKNIIANAFGIVRGQEYVFEPGLISEPVENAVQLVEYSAKKKNAIIKIEIQPDLPLVSMSKIHIQRLFLNVIANSTSFLGENGEILLKAASENGNIVVEISDNGPGFPEAILKEGIKMFRTTRKADGGTGLGLYVCSQIAEKHGGKITISNLPSGGALVKITLPALISKPDDAVAS